jgi:ribose transport system ATP-binding protein
MNEHAVEFDHVTKTFPGVVALDDVSFGIRPGEIHALVGENGAGKSTLLNLLHGVYAEYEGHIRIAGQAIHFRTTHDAIAAGVAKVHQEILLVPALSVAQNIFLGYEPRRGPFIDFGKMHRDADELLRRLNSPLTATASLVGASTGEMQMVSVAKALFHRARIISFDEPTSSLSTAETRTLMQVIRDLKAEGLTILYVSHRLDEVFEIADRVTVLRDGKHVGTYDIDEIDRPTLIRRMVGRDIANYATRHKPRCATDEVVLSVRGLSREGVFEPISFDLHRGEILGMSGLVGAKRTDVVRAIFGADPHQSGEVHLKGFPAAISGPIDALQAGIGLVPENRKTEGFVRYLSNEDNISLTCMPKFQKGLFYDARKKTANAREYVRRLNVNPARTDFQTDTMSGGNQQKIVVAKWLSTDADIIILDEPTKGIDVGAKEEMYALLEELVAAGKSLIVVSSELPEIIGLCDRVIVMKEGRQTALLDHTELTEERLLHFAMEGTDI